MKFTDSKKDQFRKLARDQGYRSRSAYKLIQLNKSYKILRKGFFVIDIGSAPGGWLQVAYNEVGDKGIVIGIDLKKVEPLENVFLIQDNIESDRVVHSILKITNSKIDVVLSDLSPNVSGNWELDHARQIDLTKNAITLSRKLMKKNGKLVLKVFQGDMLDDLINELKIDFKRVIITKPIASRQVSSELYLVCIDCKTC